MDPERYLARVFDDLARASSRDACMRIAVQAASELGDAFGLCLLTADGRDSLLALTSRDPVSLCDLRVSRLYRAATALRRSGAYSSQTLWGKEDFITLPSGHQRRIRVALIVPMRSPGHLAVSFLWQPGEIASPQRARGLELLAKVLDCNWQRAAEHDARQRDQLYNSADLQLRMRNNLMLVRSIIRRSRETSESAEQFALHLEARIGALTRIQGALITAGADGVDLEELIRTELTVSAAPKQLYEMHGPAVRVHDTAAELLALAAHELATNSLKFGALAAPCGRLSVSWVVTKETKPELRLSWKEAAVAIASTAPRRRGFGHELIEFTLPNELGARSSLEFGPGVVTCEIDTPLEACAATVAPAAQLAAGGAGSW